MKPITYLPTPENGKYLVFLPSVLRLCFSYGNSYTFESLHYKIILHLSYPSLVMLLLICLKTVFFNLSYLIGNYSPPVISFYSSRLAGVVLLPRDSAAAVPARTIVDKDRSSRYN